MVENQNFLSPTSEQEIEPASRGQSHFQPVEMVHPARRHCLASSKSGEPSLDATWLFLKPCALSVWPQACSYWQALCSMFSGSCPLWSS